MARQVRAPAIAAACVLVLTACGTSVLPSSQSGPIPSTGGGVSGGTIYVLSANDQWDQMDPQRIYTPEDLAFFGSTMYRSLEAYAYSPDPRAGRSLTPDLATDLGSHNPSATQWSFTLRNGVTWQDGSRITCADVKYGVSRTFATGVINQGPTYAIAYLNIPTLKDGTSVYKGPYKKTGQDLFDKAVTCDGRTITFNLNRPVPDFNYTVTLGFFPVPKAADVGERYGQPGHLPVSSGPYEVASYITGTGGRFVLKRNPHWDPASDPIRKAYPDAWEVDFELDPMVIDQRLIASAGKDATAIGYEPIQRADLPTVFTDPGHPRPPFIGRAVSGFDPYARYWWINVLRVRDVNIRRAMWVALDRAGLRNAMGAAFGGDYADGVINPAIGQDYAATGLLDGTLDWLHGHRIPDTGDPAFAKELINQATNKTLRLNLLIDQYRPSTDEAALVVKASLERAGFSIAIAIGGAYYSPSLLPENNDIGLGAWSADWPNASTVLPPLFATGGTWNLSQLHDRAFDAKIEAARREPDRTMQASMWHSLDKDVVENMYVLPTFFTSSQSLAGSGVGGAYRWPAYSSWPFGAMFVKR